jgi:hypothetical protein
MTTPPRGSAAHFFEAAGNTPGVAGAEQHLNEITREDLMRSPPKAVRPHWMVTRFPVSMDEFDRHKAAAAAPDTAPRATAATATPDIDVDEGMDEATLAAAPVTVDRPEDAHLGASPGPLAPAVGASFDGLGATAWQPPDCTCAVGPNHVLLAVNTDLAGYSKTGHQIFRWANMTTLFGKVLPSGAKLFDPRVAYDHYQNRWIVVAAARRDSPAGSWLLIGVSQSPDPGAGYWIWALDDSLNGGTPTNTWGDYPMLGFDTQAIYVTFNMFQVGGGYQYAKIRILNKAEMYSGGVGPNHVVRWYDFWNLKDGAGNIAFTVQPCVHFRGTGGNPPAYFVNTKFGAGSTLTLWQLDNPLALWSGGAPTLSRTDITCRSYDLPPNAQQSGSTNPIATNDNRLLSAMFQFAGGVQRVWTCHTVKYTWPGESVARSIMQWYEVDAIGRSIVQQNGFGASGTYYFFPAIQTDINRNAYLVFGRSSPSEFAALRATGRKVGDPAGSLQGSAILKSGASTYPGGRWGDYFTACRDGGNANVAWVFGEYADAGGHWGTWTASLRF